jgi:hypothetical protein
MSRMVLAPVEAITRDARQLPISDPNPLIKRNLGLFKPCPAVFIFNSCPSFTNLRALFLLFFVFFLLAVD